MCLSTLPASRALRRLGTMLLTHKRRHAAMVVHAFNTSSASLAVLGPTHKRRALSVTAAAAQAAGAAPAAAVAAADGPWLVVGLGNPGSKYDGTRHNVGFEVLDALAAELGAGRLCKLQEGAAVGRADCGGTQLVLAKPMTFMNNSGEPVRRLAKFYKVPPARIVAVYDDLDLPVGAVRLRAKGGHGGHNGMRSIIANMGNTHAFPRVRVGIGRPPGQMSVASYVLGPFAQSERTEVDIAVQEAVHVLRSVLVLGVEKVASGSRA